MMAGVMAGEASVHSDLILRRRSPRLMPAAFGAAVLLFALSGVLDATSLWLSGIALAVGCVLLATSGSLIRLRMSPEGLEVREAEARVRYPLAELAQVIHRRTVDPSERVVSAELVSVGSNRAGESRERVILERSVFPGGTIDEAALADALAFIEGEVRERAPAPKKRSKPASGKKRKRKTASARAKSGSAARRGQKRKR